MHSKAVQCKHIPDLLVLGLIEDYYAELKRHRPSPWKPAQDFPRPLPYRQLVAMGYPYKVVIAKYDKLDRAGYLEWGVSLRTSWLTDEGKAYLAKLRSAVIATPPS